MTSLAPPGGCGGRGGAIDGIICGYRIWSEDYWEKDYGV